MTAEIEDARSKRSTGTAAGTLAAMSGCEVRGRSYQALSAVDRRPPVLEQSSRSRRPVAGNGSSNGPGFWMGAATIAGR